MMISTSITVNSCVTTSGNGLINIKVIADLVTILENRYFLDRCNFRQSEIDNDGNQR